MAGAVALAGYAALLAGAGLVRLAVPDSILETVAGFYPELTTLPCPDNSKGLFSQDALETLTAHASTVTTVFLGPGLGRSAELSQLLPQILHHIVQPLVVDADALNGLVPAGTNLPDQFFQTFANRKMIVTPHAGEWARLRGKPTPTEEKQSERLCTAKDFAQKQGVILVLKGHKTIITDGELTAINPTGNPGMATGGSGDVLTGVIAGLLAQGLTPFHAAELGVCLHGLAGDIAAESLGEESVTATAILNSIPQAFTRVKEIKKRRPARDKR
jgi:NAD(P)H-hydrate epimerase